MVVAVALGCGFGDLGGIDRASRSGPKGRWPSVAGLAIWAGAVVWMALLSCWLSPRLRRWRWLRPELAARGAVALAAACRALAANLEGSPVSAVMSATTRAPTPWPVRRWLKRRPHAWMPHRAIPVSVLSLCSAVSLARPSIWRLGSRMRRMRQRAMPDLALLVSLVHQVFLSRKTPNVNNLRQF